jgi:hypothetical protein
MEGRPGHPALSHQEKEEESYIGMEKEIILKLAR